MPAVPGRAEIVAILAAFGDRPPDEVPEGIDSMELAWLVHQIELRYGGTVDDAALVRMTSVSAVVEVLTDLHDRAAAVASDPTGAAGGPDAGAAPGAGLGPSGPGTTVSATAGPGADAPGAGGPGVGG
ncbi:hypothetical protein, partial [Streptomyces sp. NPDC049040]|uniref:hypothetical protein n=1 Tax=Streptomyces sp. NPDC049040 TaxID=3365593 RepID=UPI0037213AFE